MMQYDVEVIKGILRVRWRRMVVFTRISPMARDQSATKTMERHWSCPVTDAPKVVEWADSIGATVAPSVRSYAESLWERELDAAALASSAQAPYGKFPTVRGLTSKPYGTQTVVPLMMDRCWTQYPDQKSRHRALLVADDPGLGKTLEALMSLRVEGLESARAVIVCPSGLTDNWMHEIGEGFESGTFTPWVATSETPSSVPDGVDTVVVGWAVLVHWAETLAAWAPDALVLDEGQFAKAGAQRVRKTKTRVAKRDKDGRLIRDPQGNVISAVVTEEKVTGGSAQSTGATILGKAVAKKGGLILVLTGTPIVNRPVELWPLVEIMGVMYVFGGGPSFKERYCGPKTVSRGRGKTPVRTYLGASNLTELNTRLVASGHYVRRTKQTLVEQGVLKKKYVDGAYIYDPGASPSPWVISATSEEMQAYQAAKRGVQSFFLELAQEEAAKARIPLSGPRLQEVVRTGAARHLREINNLRKAAAAIKVPYVIERARELNARGERVVIAAHLRDVVDAYAKAFSGLKIQGGMSVKDVERAKHLFNTSTVEEHPVIVLSVEAGKTGHTLCKQAMSGVGPSCAHMILAEQIWVPGDEIQTQDRIWRIGQEREVYVSNALLGGSIDGHIYATRQEKAAHMRESLGGTPPPATAQEEKKAERDGAGRIAWELVSEGLREAS